MCLPGVQTKHSAYGETGVSSCCCHQSQQGSSGFVQEHWEIDLASSVYWSFQNSSRVARSPTALSLGKSPAGSSCRLSLLSPGLFVCLHFFHVARTLSEKSKEQHVSSSPGLLGGCLVAALNTRHPHSCWRHLTLGWGVSRGVKYCWRWKKVAESGPLLHLVRKISINHPPVSNPPSHVPRPLPKADMLGQGQRHVPFLRSHSATAVMTSSGFCTGIGASLEVSSCSWTPSQAKQLGRCALQVPCPHVWRWQWLPRAPRSDTKDSQVQIFKLMGCSQCGKSAKANLSLRAEPWHLSVRAGGLQGKVSSPEEQRANCMEGAATWNLATSFSAGKVQCFIQISSNPWN